MNSGAAPEPRVTLRPVFLAWLLVSALTQFPYARAWLSPPPGRTFAGFFYFVDDQYNYLSFAQQAEDGAFLFRNKLVLAPHAGAMLNVEWWLAGRVSALLGGRPFLAYRLLGLAASFALLAGVDFWLRRSHLPDRHRLPALLLVACGGGFGGIAYRARALPIGECLDLSTGLFPFVEVLVNAHFVIGTALVLWTLAALAGGRTVLGVLLGTALGLTRPYDLLLVVAIRVLVVAATEPPRSWGRRLLPLAAFTPVAAYDYWLFYVNPAFAFYASALYPFPAGRALAVALGPPAVLAAAALARPPDDRRFWMHLAAWTAFAVAVIVLRPVHFSLQFLVGVGVPLLSLAALALARRSPIVLWTAAAAMSTTAFFAVRHVLSPSPRWYVPSERLALVEALRSRCRPRDLAFLPTDLGIFAAARTACHAYTSHPIEPARKERQRRLAWFYAGAAPAERAAFLDGLCARFVMTPAGVSTREFLGREPRGTVAFAGDLSVQEWDTPPRCDLKLD